MTDNVCGSVGQAVPTEFLQLGPRAYKEETCHLAEFEKNQAKDLFY
jgi:hypothetical protein